MLDGYSEMQPSLELAAFEALSQDPELTCCLLCTVLGPVSKPDLVNGVEKNWMGRQG